MATNSRVRSPSAPIPVLDLSGYKQVTIVKTAEVEGHIYRRGEKPTVDATTLKAIRDAGLLAADA